MRRAGMMADSLYDLIAPNLDQSAVAAGDSKAISQYLSHLASLHLHEVDDSEPAFLSTSVKTVTRNLQNLSNRAYRGFTSSAEKLVSLTSTIPEIVSETAEIRKIIPSLEEASSGFSTKYGKSSHSDLLDRRRQALLLSRSSDRIADILDLPNLLSTSITAASSASGQSSSGSSIANYGTALDLYGHVKRLKTLHPNSKVVDNLSTQADKAIERMTADLITSLRQQNVKLAGGLRTIGWLRRVAPKLTKTPIPDIKPGAQADEELLAALFLVCRLHSLNTMLSALDPLKELADRESETRKEALAAANGSGSGSIRRPAHEGQQTVKYVKKYIEIFREQSFNILSTYKGIFPNLMPSIEPQDSSTTSDRGDVGTNVDEDQSGVPPPVSTFPMHLLDILTDTLRTYLPNVQDQTARESLLTQVLYCANSLGRLGADFGMVLACLEEDLLDLAQDSKTDDDDVVDDNGKDGDTEDEIADAHEKEEDREWVRVMLKHRELSGRLELLASGLDDKQRRPSVAVS